MAIWGMGVMVGPILGPTLGGYLTELYNWRWVFFVNLPFGILATAGMAAFLPRTEPGKGMKFDWLGFGVLALGIGAFQLMLDRGETKDWFGSTEIIIEAALAGLGFYLFIVHMLMAEKPFLTPRVFKDRNLSAGLVVMFAVGMVILASSALMAPYLQTLGNYPVATAGLVMAPRGIGTMVSMMISGRLAARVDPRLLMALGVLMLLWSLYAATGWTPDIGAKQLILTLMVQGAALGFVFIPLQVVAFATLPPAMRTDGASLLSLFRNVGSAIGVSITSSQLAHNIQVVHSELGAFVNPFNRALQGGGTVSRILDPRTYAGARVLDGMINTQAQIISYIDDYKLMIWTTLPTLLLLVIMRRPGAPKVAAGAEAEASHAVLD